MSVSALRRVAGLGYWAACAVLCVAAAAVSGCATVGDSAIAAADRQYATPSDETEVHRRARIRLELAVSYLGLGQTQVALDEVKQSLAIDPTYADAYNVRGLIYMQLKDFAAADESFQRGLTLRSGDPDMMHNRAWLLCQMQKYPQADLLFEQVLVAPGYNSRSKTLMAQGVCQARAARPDDAEKTLLSAYELEVGNPVIAYNIGLLQYQRGAFEKAQFYIRRLNHTELANAESLWLGTKIERALKDDVAMRQLGDQLRRRFPDSREYRSYQQGAFND